MEARMAETACGFGSRQPARAPRGDAHLRLRNRIERFFNRLKNSRRVATRYDKLIESFAAFVILATIRVWMKFVHAI
jgi:transposase